MIFSFDGLFVGDRVLYNDPNAGWVPALIVKFHPFDEDKVPDAALAIFVTGFSHTVYSRERVAHGKSAGEWLHPEECRQLIEEPAKALSSLQRRHLKELADLELEAASKRAALEANDDDDDDKDPITPDAVAEVKDSVPAIAPEVKAEAPKEPEAKADAKPEAKPDSKKTK